MDHGIHQIMNPRRGGGVSQFVCFVALLSMIACSFDRPPPDNASPDASAEPTIDSAPSQRLCPTSYQVVAGAPSSSRYRKLEVADGAMEQASLCAADDSHLVEIDSQAESNAIEAFGANARNFFWVGLSDRETEGVWRTPTGKIVPAVEIVWGPSQPAAGAAAETEDCVLLGGGKYYDFSCSASYAAVCECDMTQAALRSQSTN